MQAASAEKIERWMQAYAALCREDNPACSEENARLAAQALGQEDYERLKWRVLKRFGVLPSEMRARHMTDREYLYCAAQLLLDEQPAMDLSRDKNAEEMKWSPLEMGAAKQAHGA